MNWEGFRTLLLTVLVLLSFVLTWNLWTNQSGTNKSEGSNFVKSDILNNGKKKIGQVVHPDMAIYQEKQDTYGFVYGTQLNALFQKISGANFEVFYTRPHINVEEKEKFNQKQPSQNKVELMFPTKIPCSLFGKILKGSNEQKASNVKVFANTENNLLFNHIIFNQSNQAQTTHMVAFFMNDSTIVAMANVSKVSFADLKTIFLNHKHEFLSEKAKKNGRVFYLPAQPHPERVNYQYSMIPAEKFKNALFPNPNLVTQQNDYYQTESLYLRANENMIKFINELPGAENAKNSQNNQNQTSIEMTFNYINSHSGWTDNYMLFQYEPPSDSKPSSEGSVTYRLIIGNNDEYPVFSPTSGPFYTYNDAGTISLTVKNGDVSILARTMMNLKQTLTTEVVNLESGEEVWKKLNSSTNVNMSFVEAIKIGYQMTYPPEKAKRITFIPNWYVLYEGNWEKVEDLVGQQNMEQKGRAS
ncbi:MAG TPA: two-component system activity regulator YycH [Bacillales bacterium]|nr:two-component system activity regulator YycH [Bacillales bacterium]